MSLESWKAIYFPTPIKDATFTEQSAVEHCLRKWRGLRAEVLEQHQIMLFSSYESGFSFHNCYVNAQTCALCVRHDIICSKCSLALSRDRFPCILKRPTETISPWLAWLENSDPEPMIQALEQALEYVKKEGL